MKDTIKKFCFRCMRKTWHTIQIIDGKAVTTCDEH